MSSLPPSTTPPLAVSTVTSAPSSAVKRLRSPTASSAASNTTVLGPLHHNDKATSPDDSSSTAKRARMDIGPHFPIAPPPVLQPEIMLGSLPPVHHDHPSTVMATREQTSRTLAALLNTASSLLVPLASLANRYDVGTLDPPADLAPPIGRRLHQTASNKTSVESDGPWPLPIEELPEDLVTDLRAAEAHTRTPVDHKRIDSLVAAFAVLDIGGKLLDAAELVLNRHVTGRSDYDDETDEAEQAEPTAAEDNNGAGDPDYRVPDPTMRAWLAATAARATAAGIMRADAKKAWIPDLRGRELAGDVVYYDHNDDLDDLDGTGPPIEWLSLFTRVKGPLAADRLASHSLALARQARMSARAIMARVVGRVHLAHMSPEVAWDAGMLAVALFHLHLKLALAMQTRIVYTDLGYLLTYFGHAIQKTTNPHQLVRRVTWAVTETLNAIDLLEVAVQTQNENQYLAGKDDSKYIIDEDPVAIHMILHTMLPWFHIAATASMSPPETLAPFYTAWSRTLTSVACHGYSCVRPTVSDVSGTDPGVEVTDAVTMDAVRRWADAGVSRGKAAIAAATLALKRVEAATAAAGPSAGTPESDGDDDSDDSGDDDDDADADHHPRPTTGRRAVARAQRVLASTRIYTAQSIQQAITVLDTSAVVERTAAYVARVQAARAPTAHATDHDDDDLPDPDAVDRIPGPAPFGDRMTECDARTREATAVLEAVERNDRGAWGKLPPQMVRNAVRLKREVADAARKRAARVVAIERRRNDPNPVQHRAAPGYEPTMVNAERNRNRVVIASSPPRSGAALVPTTTTNAAAGTEAWTSPKGKSPAVATPGDHRDQDDAMQVDSFSQHSATDHDNDGQVSPVRSASPTTDQDRGGSDTESHDETSGGGGLRGMIDSLSAMQRAQVYLAALDDDHPQQVQAHHVVSAMTDDEVADARQLATWMRMGASGSDDEHAESDADSLAAFGSAKGGGDEVDELMDGDFELVGDADEDDMIVDDDEDEDVVSKKDGESSDEEEEDELAGLLHDQEEFGMYASGQRRRG
ncbi:hypothetical protein BC828DRAFT_215462 [Blastocladiella britannica]|nr:hypothetical protein BC828DRAFT_215462 [Blastocladiella britannica]